MANFCVATGYPPEVYHRLTMRERLAFIHELNRRRR